MEQHKNNIAIVSVSKDAYSETFIKAQRERLSGQIFYLWGGEKPIGSTDGKLEEFLADRKIAIISKLKKYNMFDYAFHKYLKYHKIQLVIAQYGTTGSRIVSLCAPLGIPVIVHFHGYDAYQYATLKAYQKRYLTMFEKAAAIVAVSKDMKAQLISLGTPADKVHLCTYGPNPTFFTCKPSFRKLNFISVGRFVDKKAPYLTIAAFKEVVEDFPNAKLKMAGGLNTNPLIETCQNLVQYWGLEKNVEFLGPVSHQKVKELFNEAYAFVQHSIRPIDGDSEGTPNAVLEASAAALPIISTKHAGISDVVIPEKTGYLVKERDVSGMASYMKKLASNSEFARRMGEAGRAYVKDKFSMDSYIENLNKLIASCIHY